MNNIHSYNFYGLKISSFTKEELISSINDTVNSIESRIYYGYSLAALMYIKKYPTYHAVTSNFDVLVADGRIFYLMARFFGYKLKYDISIPRLTMLVLEIANKQNLKLQVIGGTKETYEFALQNISDNYLNIQLCKGRNGYFKDDEKEGVFNSIESSEPNILLLGFPTPSKQIFASEIKDRIKGCVIIPCGGMIDVLAGKEKLTPIWLKKIGLASIYRHIQHPDRLPELLGIFFLALKVFIICSIKKFLFRSSSINMTEIV